MLEGYNQIEYIACIVFKTKARRDICAGELLNLKVNLTTRNDAIIPDGFYKQSEVRRMDFLIGFIVGLVVGGNLGLMIVALVNISRDEFKNGGGDNDKYF